MKILTAILFVSAISSCTATKKNVSSTHQLLDSSANSTTEAMHSINLDSSVKTIDQSIFTKFTETGFQPLEIDSVYPPLRPLPNGMLVIKSPNPGKQIILLPKTITAEKSLNNIASETHLQKRDTGYSAEKKAVQIHTEKTESIKKKISIGFNWWWLLLLLLLPFLSPQFRQKLIDKIKIFVP